MTPELPEHSESLSPEPTGDAIPKPAAKRRQKRNRPPVPASFGKGTYVDMSGVRHQARVLAMQALYERDITQHGLEDILGRMRTEEDVELPESAMNTADEDENRLDDIPQPVADHASAIVQGVLAHQREIDPLIEQAAPQFPIPQLATVDRNVLRLAIYELLHAPDVPFKVAINEAVEIAKRFGGPNSGRFVNGVLGTISNDLPPERKTNRS